MKETDKNTDKDFVLKTLETQQIWGLKSKDGWAVAMSNEYDDVQVYVFWTTASDAVKCAKEEWNTYSPAPIPLAEFLEDWCVGVFEENSLIGINWDFNMCGQEIEPMELAKAMMTELKRNNSSIEFQKYETLQELSAIIDQAILNDQNLA